MTEAETTETGTTDVRRLRAFHQVLVNTAVANVTTSFLWFGLTFWAYLETRSVLATGIIGGTYMLFVAFFGILFGSIVDRHRKHRAMVLSGVITLVAFSVAAVVYLAAGQDDVADLGRPWFWVFAAVVLAGSVVENLRNVALSTTVTLLVPVERHANANGLVGTVQGVAFIVTSVFSGLAIGLLGMGGTLVIALVLTAAAFVHLLTIRIPEAEPVREPGRVRVFDLAGSLRTVRAVPALFALIVFSSFNNLIGGVYMALMDPYGLTLFSVEVWGIVFGVASTGFIVGGLLIAKFGLGRNPIRTMLMLVMVMGALGSLFTVREWWWLYAVGIFLYLVLIPAVEAAEQTVIQKVVPFERQGRAFGFAQAFESAAAPITAFLIAPLAEFWIIPTLRSDSGAAAWEPLLGTGEARGIAVVFFFAGLVMIVAAALAFASRSYRTLSREYGTAVPSEPAAV
ncbi:DHA3 family multidrug efflux protein-like MFS transporter [Curtobacterium flaccumfaciens]|uniref:DHA3 family multidrug efflux protein-like MFS transporter n=1 Tax=Curtobacterium flaccumfaciens TaxID=2035 RepID=A0A4R6DHL0_9MICO|nr:MFS transporter [Curtobacterium flaccumfaciens]TDN44226.1 DHA3 family multidrug efflux protein-like MFS transporter [Curtobacterium flaccumfaciens]